MNPNRFSWHIWPPECWGTSQIYANEWQSCCARISREPIPSRCRCSCISESSNDQDITARNTHTNSTECRVLTSVFIQLGIRWSPCEFDCSKFGHICMQSIFSSTETKISYTFPQGTTASSTANREQFWRVSADMDSGEFDLLVAALIFIFQPYSWCFDCSTIHSYIACVCGWVHQTSIADSVVEILCRFMEKMRYLFLFSIFCRLFDLSAECEIHSTTYGQARRRMKYERIAFVITHWNTWSTYTTCDTSVHGT